MTSPASPTWWRHATARCPWPHLLADLRSPALHAWQPPGGGEEGALVHCVIHALDIVEAVPLDRRVPAARIRPVLEIVAARKGRGPNLFGVDLSDVELRADDLEWSSGSGALVTGSAQALALVACGRLLPPGRLRGEAASASAGRKRLGQLAASEARRSRARCRRAACSTGTGRPASPVRHGVRPSGGSAPCRPARPTR